MSELRPNYFVALMSLLLILGAGVWLSSAARADEHRSHDRESRDHDSRDRGFREHEFREHEFREHEYMDTRFHHDHYYPPRGFVFGMLPREHHVVFFGGAQYYFGAGVWYRRHNERFIVVAPPFGVMVPILPAGYATVWVGGSPYYYANNVYYVRHESGYMVVQDPPPTMIVEQPMAKAPPPTNGVIELGPVNSSVPAQSGQPVPVQPIAAGTATAPQFFIYPRQGQSQELQAKDRYECHGWAVSQLGSDPTAMPAGQASPRLPDYQRALGACMDGRGYTLK